ncbi:MAG TPA: aldo/keto reductase [Dissulfurispiraceae bacterium]|nr:aldo/keto reductase [Thermodesulfovibrionales bacterium]HMK57078.1 aldo/keto reductase [Dissulfurispiraceae bacterium]
METVSPIQRRRLGKTGVDVTILGLGGEGVLRTHGHDSEAYALINRAIDLGINYFDSAKAYAGCESYHGKALGERRKEIFLTGKSHARDKKGALNHLHDTLRTIKTDHLDLWQMHDMRTEDDIAEASGSGGALEAFREAKEKGLVRFIGVTGHHDPAILRRCIDIADFDTVLIPVNPAEPHYLNFIEDLMPYAVKKDLGIIAMKIYFRGLAARIPGYVDMEPFYRFALSHPVSLGIIGCDNISQLEQNVGFAQSFSQMGRDEMDYLAGFVEPYARSLMYYKP